MGRLSRWDDNELGKIHNGVRNKPGLYLRYCALRMGHCASNCSAVQRVLVDRLRLTLEKMRKLSAKGDDVKRRTYVISMIAKGNTSAQVSAVLVLILH